MDGSLKTIYLQDEVPPALISYDFTFTNTENQNRIYSYAPISNSTYSMNSIVINGVPISGEYGRLVALP